MANLIITVIAIALVAVASLMGAYYGGSAFLNNQSAANASTVLNQGQQLAGAWQAYLGDNLNVAPVNASLLVTNGYVAQIPDHPEAPGPIAAGPMYIGSATATVGGVSGTHYFAYADMGKSTVDPVGSSCIRIIKTAVGTAPAAVPTAAQGAIFNTATTGNGTFGCAKATAAITAGTITTQGNAAAVAPAATDYVMEYLLE